MIIPETEITWVLGRELISAAGVELIRDYFTQFCWYKGTTLGYLERKMRPPLRLFLLKSRHEHDRFFRAS